VVDTQERWHARTAEDALALLGTAAGGLTQAEADARLRDHGANVLPSPKRRSPVVRFLLQFHNILIYVLIGAAVITAFLDHLTDTFVIDLTAFFVPVDLRELTLTEGAEDSQTWIRCGTDCFQVKAD
jgi:magnesium-transporting ATPase (P-type)